MLTTKNRHVGGAATARLDDFFAVVTFFAGVFFVVFRGVRFIPPSYHKQYHLLLVKNETSNDNYGKHGNSDAEKDK